MKPLRKAIFPVAGMGTRFLPATKSVPKEMLTVVIRPVIDYAVREAVEAGCDTFDFHLGRSKQAIANYFDRSPELEKRVEEKTKRSRSKEIVRNIIPSHVNCIYIRQAEPLGLGHAVHCGSPLVHPDEYFAVLLPDDLIDGYQKGALQQMNEVHERTGSSVIALEQVSWDEVSQYGVVAPKNEHQIPIELAGIVEKPKRERCPFKLDGGWALHPQRQNHAVARNHATWRGR